MKKLTLGSLFDGMGGWQLAAIETGITPVWSSEIEKFPCALTKERFPNTLQLGDINKINKDEVTPTDIVCAGSPCFHEETKILTANGYKNIKDVCVGEVVLGSDGFWHIVEETMITPSNDIYKLKIEGSLETIVTGNHPYLVKKEDTVVWSSVKELSCGDFVGFPIIQTSRNPFCITEEMAWVIGRFLLTEETNEKSFLKTKEENINRLMKEIIKKVSSTKNISTYEIVDDFLLTICNLCQNKTVIPQIILDLPPKILEAFWRGVLGINLYHFNNKDKKNKYYIEIANLSLAYGLQTIIHKIYKNPCQIVFEKNKYIIKWKKGHSKNVFHNCVWQRVIKKEKINQEMDMYNLEIKDVHTYIANGVVVHNCQDLSVAGKRKGLKGARSGLFYKAIDIIRNMRERTNGEYPKFFCFENVKGVFSSNRGFDFKSVLEEISETEIPMPIDGKWAEAGMAKLPKCDIAWRTLDAQYWGVPQRRKRVFLIADFRARGERSVEVLFERKSLQGNFEESASKKEKTAFGIGNSTKKASKPLGFNINAGIADNNPVLSDCTPTLKANTRIGVQICYNICAYSSNSMLSSNPFSGIYKTEKSRTLDCNGGNPSCNQGGLMIVTNKRIYDIQHRGDVIRPVKNICPTLTARMGTGGGNVPIVHSFALQGSMIGRKDKNGPQGSGILEEKCFTLNTIDRHAVCKTKSFGKISFSTYEETKISPSLRASGGDFGGGSEAVYLENSVRRLTPLECERLQGLPDNFTLIESKACSDAARYKALGNGMAHPCAKFVMERIVKMVTKNG